MKASEYKKQYEEDAAIIKKHIAILRENAKLCIWIKTKVDGRGGKYKCKHPKGSGCGGGVCRQYYRHTQCILYATPDTEVDENGVPI